MTQQDTHNNEEHMKKDSALSLSVLETIDAQQVHPVPKWKFALVEYSIWVLWILTVLCGAVAFSVIIFVFTHASFAFYEVTHEDGMHFLLEILPYMWVGAFGLMALVAHYNLRLTKRGYKFQVWQVLVSSIVASFVTGLVLHVVGVGFLVDSFISKKMPMLPTLERSEIQMWQHPEEGRMVGTYEVAGKEQGTFTDTNGDTWIIGENELSPLDLELLHAGQMVRLIGVPATSTSEYFHGCAVLPWTYQRDVSFIETMQQRDTFIESMQMHHERMQMHQKDMQMIHERVMQGIMASGTAPDFITRPLCGSHNAVMRMETKFRY